MIKFKAFDKDTYKLYKFYSNYEIYSSKSLINRMVNNAIIKIHLNGGMIMIFIIHIAIFLGLIALVSGVYLFTWSSKIDDKCYKVFAWCIGLIITIMATLGLICVGLYGAMYQRAGYFDRTVIMNSINMQNNKPMLDMNMPMDQKGKKEKPKQ